jgi:chromosome segregation ATPase
MESMPSGRDEVPWWRSKLTITVLGGLIAAIAPTTSGIHGCVSKDREIGLARIAQAHDIRLKYLDRAIDPTKTPVYRKQVLELLAEMSEHGEETMRWAKAQIEVISAEIEELKAAKAKQDADLKAAQEKQGQLETEIREKESAIKKLRTQADSADKRAGLAALENERLRKQNEAAALDQKAAESLKQVAEIDARLRYRRAVERRSGGHHRQA